MEGGRWNHNICSCSAVSCSTWCISGCICSPCQLTKLHSHVLGESPPRICSTLPCLISWAGFVFPLAPFLQHCYVRAAVRDEMRVWEDGCSTVFISTCCSGSSLIQMAATLHKQKNVPAFVFMDEDDRNPLLEGDERDVEL